MVSTKKCPKIHCVGFWAKNLMKEAEGNCKCEETQPGPEEKEEKEQKRHLQYSYKCTATKDLTRLGGFRAGSVHRPDTTPPWEVYCLQRAHR